MAGSQTRSVEFAACDAAFCWAGPACPCAPRIPVHPRKIVVNAAQCKENAKDFGCLIKFLGLSWRFAKPIHRIGKGPDAVSIVPERTANTTAAHFLAAASLASPSSSLRERRCRPSMVPSRVRRAKPIPAPLRRRDSRGRDRCGRADRLVLEIRWGANKEVCPWGFTSIPDSADLHNPR